MAQRKHDQPLPKAPYTGEINPGDRVVFLMPVNRGKPYPVGAEVESITSTDPLALHTFNARVVLYKLSVCTDPNVRMDTFRHRIVINKGPSKAKHRKPDGPTNVWIAVNGERKEKL